MVKKIELAHIRLINVAVPPINPTIVDMECGAKKLISHEEAVSLDISGNVRGWVEARLTFVEPNVVIRPPCARMSNRINWRTCIGRAEGKGTVLRSKGLRLHKALHLGKPTYHEASLCEPGKAVRSNARIPHISEIH